MEKERDRRTAFRLVALLGVVMFVVPLASAAVEYEFDIARAEYWETHRGSPDTYLTWWWWY